jgi:hypothetical protein
LRVALSVACSQVVPLPDEVCLSLNMKSRSLTDCLLLTETFLSLLSAITGDSQSTLVQVASEMICIWEVRCLILTGDTDCPVLCVISHLFHTNTAVEPQDRSRPAASRFITDFCPVISPI